MRWRGGSRRQVRKEAGGGLAGVRGGLGGTVGGSGGTRRGLRGTGVELALAGNEEGATIERLGVTEGG